MKKLMLFVITLFITAISFAQTRHPYYGGGHHTTSHGGYYAGSTNAHHRGGHYKNYRTVNTYGRHKRRWRVIKVYNVRNATDFLGRESGVITKDPGMRLIHEALFDFLGRNSSRVSKHFNLPSGKVFEIGYRISLYTQSNYSLILYSSRNFEAFLAKSLYPYNCFYFQIKYKAKLFRTESYRT